MAPWAMLGGEEDSRVGGVGLGDSILGGGANLGNGVMENIGVNPLRNFLLRSEILPVPSIFTLYC